MIAPGKGASRKGKQQNTAQSWKPAGPTPAERAKQSKEDKAKHQALVAAATIGSLATQQPNRLRKGRARPARGGGGPRAGQGQVTRFLSSLRRGMPSAVPTRLEVLHFRARYSLTVGEEHMILFHPSNNVALGLITSYMAEARDLAGFDRGTAGAPVQWVPSTDMTGTISECMGVPDSLVSSIGRVTGGVMTIKVTGCDGATGYAVSSCPMRGEIMDHKSVYERHATSVRLKRHEIGANTRDFAFHAPVLAPAAMETFTGTNDRYSWGEDDPFGGIAVTFHNLQYNATYGMPFVVELDMQVGIQSRLTLDDRHLSTNHATEKGAAKCDLHSEKNMGHIGSGTGASSQAVQSSASKPAGVSTR